MASCEIAYVHASRQSMDVMIPIWGADHRGNPNANDIQREAEAVAENLYNHGWFWMEIDPEHPTRTNRNGKEVPNYRRCKPLISYTKVNGFDPHFSASLAKQQGTA